VGFIQKLPTHLVAAFRATLEEITEADFLLHVVDFSHFNAIPQWHSVNNTLRDIGAGEIPMLTVLNKCDKVENPVLHMENSSFPGECHLISALERRGLSDVTFKLQELLFERYEFLEVKIPYRFGQLISLFHKFGNIDVIEHGIESVSIKGRMPLRFVPDFEEFRKIKG
jgi:GTP-binding protein HflX